MKSTNSDKKTSLLIPTYNAGLLWQQVLNSIDIQNFEFHRKIIVDSGSKDDTVKQAKQHGFEVIQIPQSEFNHGATRQLLVENSGADIALFLTQDAILANEHSIKNLVAAFTDPNVALAYGRQLPHEGAKPLETHARLFNYPDKSVTRSLAEKEQMGFKVFFCSNSYAAYRIDALNAIGGFPSDSIMGEDALSAARLLLKNYKIAYVAQAIVQHSHSYSISEEFRRYFDTRVFHEQNKWLINEYGKPTGEGIKYLKSELNYITNNNIKSLPKVFTSIGAKWLGYSLGGFYKNVPRGLLKKLSMHASYWK